MKDQKKERFLKLYIWLFAGILMSIAVSFMRISGSANLNAFLDQGRVYDFVRADLTSSMHGGSYNPEGNYYTVEGERARKNFRRLESTETWSYLKLEIANLNAASSEWQIDYLDADRNRISSQTVNVTNGYNAVTIDCAEPFRYLRFRILGQSGLTFSLNSMQLRERDVVFTSSDFVKNFLPVFGVYLLISALIWLARHIKAASVVEVVQYAFGLFGNYAGSRLTKTLDTNQKNRMRTLLFWFIYVYMILFHVFGLYADKEYYKYGVLGVVAAVILIGLLSWEKPLHYVKWNGILPMSWVALWTWACVSDLVVSKFFKFTGYVFLFGVGFFFFVWNNMEHPKAIRNNMIHGLMATFPIVIVYCLLFRQKYQLVFYNGVFSTRKEMALYALMVLIAFLAELFYYLRYEGAAFKKKIVLYGVGTAVSCYFLQQTGVVTCMAAAAVVLLLFLYKLLREYRHLPMGAAKTAGILAAALVCSAAVVLPFHKVVQFLPERIGTAVQYEDELFETDFPQETVNAFALSDPEFYSRVTQENPMSYKLVWTNYLRHVNLMGNSDRLKVGGIRTYAQSGLIDMIYRYGLVVLIPYLLMLFFCFYHAIRERGFLMLATTIAFTMTLITQNIENPFAQPLWIIFYLGMGIWFGKDEGEEREIEEGE